MAVKKSFKTEWNPALQFISMPEEVGPEIPEPVKAGDIIEGPKAPQEPDSSQARNKREGPKAPEPDISQTNHKIEGAKPPAGYKANPMYVETKSRRLQLLMQPSLYERVKARAGAEGQSVNEWIHACLEEGSQG